MMEIPLTNPGNRVAVSAGLLVTLLVWETLSPFFPLFGRGANSVRSRLRHGALNLVLGALNAALVALLFTALWLAVARWTTTNRFGLLNASDFPPWLRLLLAVLLLDAWTYCWHRLNHRVRFFWRFHRLHHADRAMDVTTATRFHAGEIALSSLLRVPILFVLGCHLEELALYELLLFAVVQFHHANIALPAGADRWLRRVIVTPSLHKVHHSVVRAECDSNYASLFSFWDRLFGTQRISADPRQIIFGVDE